MQSRLSRTKDSKTKKQLAFSLVGIILVIFVLFKFGIPALTSLSLFLSSKNGTTPEEIAKSKTLLTPPILTQSFSATSSASITVNGTASPKQTIQLYVNGSLVDTTPTRDDGSFQFTGVNLTQQQNTIQAKARSTSSGQDKTSDYSDTWNVSYLQKAPSLSVDSPHDNDNVGGSVVVKGKTDPDVRVTVNDFWAIVDASGNYSYTLSVQNGDTHIVVVATNAAGATTKQELTVHHQ